MEKAWQKGNLTEVVFSLQGHMIQIMSQPVFRLDEDDGDDMKRETLMVHCHSG